VGALPGPAGGAYSAPSDPLAGSWGRETEGREGEGREWGRKGREKEERGREKVGEGYPSPNKNPAYGPVCSCKMK